MSDDLGLIIFLGIAVLIVIAAVLFISDWGSVLRYRLMGRDIIVIEDQWGESWHSWIEIAPVSRKATAWRFPATKIGRVDLEDDGRGYYCGPVTWRRD